MPRRAHERLLRGGIIGNGVRTVSVARFAFRILSTALRGLKATSAAAVQLGVPVFAAIGGIAMLGESISLRLLIASTAILGGIALVIVETSAAELSRFKR